MSGGFISDVEASYIQLLLEDKSIDNKKHGLQRLCKHYENGLRLRHPHPFRQILNGLLHNQSERVVRWSLNSTALIGRATDNLNAVIEAIKRNREKSQLVLSGVSALFKLCNAEEVTRLLELLEIPLEREVLLAAAQYSRLHQQRLLESRVDIETAAPLELQMATLLVGMDRAPENLFHADHPNRALISALNRHDNNRVSQYSVWAICESKSLELSDLGIPLKDIEAMPANVRGWIYRLLVADKASAIRHRELIVVGSEDKSDVAREGMATGLRNVYFDGLEEVLFRWLPDEESDRIRGRIWEHMAACSDSCSAYSDAVLEQYRNTGKLQRGQLEAAAQGTRTYGVLKRFSLANEEASLDFGKSGASITMVTQHINTAGGSVGAVSGTGDILSHSIAAVGTLNSNSDLKPVLEMVLTFIQGQVLHSERKTAGAELVRAAAVTPSKTTLTKLLGWLMALKEGTDYAVAGVLIGEAIAKLSGILNHM